MATTIRFGVLGAARIAPTALLEPAAKLTDVAVTCIGARSIERAETLAAEHGITTVVGSYDEVIASPDVDVVYNPLPMALHAEWTIAALRAGKHVLCEKPLAANANEAAEMVRVAEAEGRVLAEAFHYRYHPMFERILAEVGSGRIGAVRRVEGVFNVTTPRVDPRGGPEIRWDFAMAGGSLMDHGCYPLSWARHVIGQEPQVVAAEATVDVADIDTTMSCELAFPGGATASLFCAMDRGPEARLRIEGEHGSITAHNPLAPQLGNQLVISTNAGTTAGPIDAGITYDHMLRAFVDHVVLGAPFPTSGHDSIANMTAIDAIYRAAGLPTRG